ncbi:unnamed protein product [Chrysoparadoxa australica]
MQLLLAFGLSLAMAPMVAAGMNKRCGCAVGGPGPELETNEGRTPPPLDTSTPAYGHREPAAMTEDVPLNFSWSNVDGTNFLTGNWNQHIPTYCGSCYAHGTLAALNDRIKIARGASAPDVMLSRQSFLNCSKWSGFGSGCGGGVPPDVFRFMHEVGLPDDTCNNYVAKTTDVCDTSAMCMNCMVVEQEGELVKECWPIENYTKYYVSEYGTVRGEKAIQAEVFQNGPISCGFISDENFDFGYGGGIWRESSSSTDPEEVNHIVEIVGWGEHNGVKFWQARNSWGSYWGEEGFFKIERGVNLSLIENECFFAAVDVTEEQRVRGGGMTGGMHGLVTEDTELAEQSRAYEKALREVDWSKVALPGALAERENLSTFEEHNPRRGHGPHVPFSVVCSFSLGLLVATVTVRARSSSTQRPYAVIV